MPTILSFALVTRTARDLRLWTDRMVDLLMTVLAMDFVSSTSSTFASMLEGTKSTTTWLSNFSARAFAVSLFHSMSDKKTLQDGVSMIVDR